jgi:LysM repeat protein
MTAKRILRSIVVVIILAASFSSTGVVLAWSGCSASITVQTGDTLSSIAAACGTTVEAIMAANPEMIWSLAPGQMLNIPANYTSSAQSYYPVQVGGTTYVVQWGDTLGNIAAMNGVSLGDLLAVNPQIWDASLIFAGQVITIPAPITVPASTYYPSTNYPSTYNPYLCTPTPDNPSACNSLTGSPTANYQTTGNYPPNYDPSICNPSPYNPSACNPSNYYPSTNIPSTYDPTACNPSPYNPSACNPSTETSSTDNSSNNFISIVAAPPYSVLRVTSGHGLIVRTGAGTSYSEIHSPLVAALNHSHWWYLKNTVTVDSTGLVWVEIQLSPLVSGYTTGWIMVRDSLGNHFTEPMIDP